MAGRTHLHPLLEEWAGDMASENKSPRTIAGYLVDLRQFQHFLRDRELTRVRAEDVRRFSHTMTRAGLQPRSRSRRLVAIRRFYDYLARTGRLPQSPAQEIRPPRAKPRTPNFLTPQEVQALRRAIPGTDRGVRDRAVIELGLQSLRISEILGLDLDDLHLDRQQVRIIGKGGGEVLQPITEAGVRATEAWLRRRPLCRSRALFIPLPPRGPQTRLHYTTVEKAFHFYLAAAGITRPLRFHDLRHTVGVTLADRGVPLQFIQDLLRHRDPKTTRVYTQVARERLAEVLDRELEFPE
ncbi:MAG TPA: tyrosine-type recombinase/integrase [bacterium]|nr:tyrosine-type recombinase/integrase [bacterium]